MKKIALLFISTFIVLNSYSQESIDEIKQDVYDYYMQKHEMQKKTGWKMLGGYLRNYLLPPPIFH